jgi:hypothetical protein
VANAGKRNEMHHDDNASQQQTPTQSNRELASREHGQLYHEKKCAISVLRFNIYKGRKQKGIRKTIKEKRERKKRLGK